MKAGDLLNRIHFFCHIRAYHKLFCDFADQFLENNKIMRVKLKLEIWSKEIDKSQIPYILKNLNLNL